MKNLKYIIVTVLALISTSCKDFLTVNPKTEMTKDLFFSTEAGFKDALSGVYIQMKGNNVYGQAMTMTAIEQLISSWDVTANTVEQKLGLFNFTDATVEKSLSSIYSGEYKVIASINAILNQIDERKDVFKTPGMYETIKAECLALRAYCHLDILRLFGPIPTDPSTGNMLAYVTLLSKTPNQLIPFAQYQEALIKDLTDAEFLLKDIDPVIKYSLAELRNPSQTAAFNPADTYFAYRYYRMNYYAVKALQARAYLWFNNKEKAFECAKLVIDAKSNDGSAKFRLGTATDMTNKDYVLTCEHICGLYDFNLYKKYNDLYAAGTLKKGSTATTVTTQLYGNTGTDIREANLWELITLANQSKCYVLKKYQMVEKPQNLAADIKQIPLLRISEMYLIAIEAGTLADAQALWATFRTSRNIAVTTLPADPTALKYELLKEYRKEFYAEGQAYFAYKRINAPKANTLFIPAAAAINYLIPLPKTETINLN
ncbi:RagB/SusD family nutrient uptake outer membrane protein [Solitalea koreensis]|uniref:SusD family protein n=1 Tax=Solitalea koreensis TaxID=543615 RepID=A0A521DSI1_9SPHI|nr:RagB/SusD family nutrient uptake outer membrane protein [Solitalea koreensis]SMO74667.1 SusD family protein [Solitalea koreensis]